MSARSSVLARHHASEDTAVTTIAAQTATKILFIHIISAGASSPAVTVTPQCR
jgi:hypothetical protein